MKASTLTRLAKLESAICVNDRPPDEDSFARAFHAALVAIVAHHAGDWQEGEPPVEALMRALDVTHDEAAREMADAAGPGGQLLRAADAVFTSRGWRLLMADVDDMWAQVRGPLAALLAEVPPALRKALGVSWVPWMNS